MEKYYELRNYRCIVVKFLNATNTKGSRVKMTTEKKDGSKVSKTISYNYNFNSIGEIAYDYLTALGWNVICKAQLHSKDILLCDNWANDFIELK